MDSAFPLTLGYQKVREVVWNQLQIHPFSILEKRAEGQ
jgi:hypothetical protein